MSSQRASYAVVRLAASFISTRTRAGSSVSPTAITSSNYHLDHFGVAFDIRTADGEVAHSSCVGFGLERIALALFKTHGMDPEAWPREVRSVLSL